MLTGEPEPSPNTLAGAPAPIAAPSANRLRDYQDRLRVLDERARQQLLSEPAPEPVLPAAAYAYESSSGAAPAPDPLVADRKRREYESLFASNVVLSRRPEAQRPVTGGPSESRGRSRLADEGLPATPTIDEVADAVVRATTRLQPPPVATSTSGPIPTAAS